jgi:Domain of unknown function (DUF397)
MDIGQGVLPGWRRSGRCTGGDCVEVLIGHDRVSMRDSKDLTAGVLDLSRGAWAAFVADVRDDAFRRD